MDPITHTVLGATTAHVLTSSRLGRGALLFGAAGGLLPDADVFWGGAISDPALPWEFHRHFTHALAFIPIGGALAAAPLLLLFKGYRPLAGWAYLAATIGCATHGLCDTLTSFGTFLYWPFSNERIAWDVISIIDPLFTVPLILGLLIAAFIGKAWPTRIVFVMALMYLALGYVQHERVMRVQERLAEARGHEIERGRAMPTMANLLIWRSLYEADGRLYADAVRASLTGPAMVREGDSAARFDHARFAPSGPAAERLGRVISSFVDFADAYVIVVWEDEEILGLGDARYSLVTAGFEPLWGIVINSGEEGQPVLWTSFRDGSQPSRRDALASLWKEIVRGGDGYREVGE